MSEVQLQQANTNANCKTQGASKPGRSSKASSSKTDSLCLPPREKDPGVTSSSLHKGLSTRGYAFGKTEQSLQALRTGFPDAPTNILKAIDRVAKEQKIDPLLVAAIVKKESTWNPTAGSPKGALGLMQLMPRTGRKFGASNRADPYQNLTAGTKYLKYLLDRYSKPQYSGGNEHKALKLALAAYNAGEPAVDKAGYNIPAKRETQDYVRKVTADYTRARAAAF